VPNHLTPSFLLPRTLKKERKTMKLFAQIFKVNAETGEVHGRITQEAPDNSGEIMDYETSKPNFQDWSKQASDATGGLSKGNVRAMHGRVAAGKLTDISFLDEVKAIDVVAKIVDEGERQKCIEGVYTGFSIGGKYAKRWQDGDLWRYTAQPSEVSLVDNPCLKSARFTLVKADGTEEERDFEKVAAREDVNPKSGEKKYGDVKFADAKNKKYPIDTEAHIRAAWNYINKEKNAAKYSAEDAKSIKSAIVAAWKDKIDKEGPPSAAKSELDGDLKKYLGEEAWDVSQALSALNTIYYLYSKEQQENHPESADQTAQLKTVIDALKAFIASEIQEEDADMAMADGVTLFLAKVGARNSKTDAGKIQTIHDHAAALGADCGGSNKMEEGDMSKEDLEKLDALAAKVETLEKSHGETLEKLAKAEEENVALKVEVEAIKTATPKPGGPVLRVVTKAQELGEVKSEVEPIKKEDGTIDRDATALALTKAAMANPVQLGRP
jgi:hypothetical protein